LQHFGGPKSDVFADGGRRSHAWRLNAGRMNDVLGPFAFLDDEIFFVSRGPSPREIGDDVALRKASCDRVLVLLKIVSMLLLEVV
jgi:hypothetical protein